MSKVIKFDRKNFSRGIMAPKAKIIAVGGGKGGVGKSFVSSNLGIFLANMGHDTVLVDLDLGAANLHTSLGEEIGNKNLHNFIDGRVKKIEDVAIATQFPQLRLITGTNDVREVANISVHEKSRLMSALFHLDAEYVVLDLSAGTHSTTLDFFLMAQHHVVTFTPEPSSIENAYRFMKTSFFRKIKRFERQFELEKTVARLMKDPSKAGIRYPADLIQIVSEKDPIRGQKLAQEMSRLDFQIVLNQCRTSTDARLGPSIQSVCRKYFGLSSNFLGHLNYDNAVWQSLRKRRPLLLENPSSPLYAQVLGIVRDLSAQQSRRSIV